MLRNTVVYLVVLLFVSQVLAQAPNLKNQHVPNAANQSLLLDADSANEIDDLFAIAYLLKMDGVNLIGITSAQWFHLYSGDSTMWKSHLLNQELVALAGKTELLPVVPGADRIMGDPWGGYTPRQSPATDFIITESHKLSEGQKLDIMCIGASTNLASALAIDSTLHTRIRVWMLGFQYDFEKGVWNKDEFNIRRDLNAANYVLNCEGLELHVMPISVAKQYTWSKAETFAKLEDSGNAGAYLKSKWRERFETFDSWVMWDVALLQAYLKPEQGEEILVSTPLENKARQVFMYRDIDEKSMLKDYWRVLLK